MRFQVTIVILDALPQCIHKCKTKQIGAKGQSEMDNPDIGNIAHTTQDWEKQNKKYNGKKTKDKQNEPHKHIWFDLLHCV